MVRSPFALLTRFAGARSVRAVLPALLLLSGGCADFHGIVPGARPATPESIGAGRLSPLPPAADGAWWAALGDPQLDRLVAQVLADNPDLRIAAHRIEEARAIAALVRSGTAPQLGVTAEFTRERFSETHVFPPPLAGTVYWNNEATLNFSYDLDLWGRDEKLLTAAVDETHAAAAQARQVRLALSAAVVRTYAAFAGDFELLDLARTEAGRLENAIAIAQRRRAAGLGAGQDVDGLEAARSRQLALIEAGETNLRLARHALAALAGLGPAAGDALDRPQLAPAAMLVPPAHVPAELVGRRPDLVAQRWRVEAAAARIDAAKAAFYPNIDLTAFVGIQSLDFAAFFNPASLIHGVGPALSLPIFDGGRRRARLSLETSGYDAAVESYNTALVRALAGVADELTRFAGTARELALAADTLAAAERRLAAAERGWRAGVSPFQGVLDARLAVHTAREARVRLETARRQVYAALLFALGGAAGSDDAGLALAAPPP